MLSSTMRAGGCGRIDKCASGLRRVPAVIYKVPSVPTPPPPPSRGMRSGSVLAGGGGGSDMEKSLPLIILQHKSCSVTSVLLTCVHLLPHNDQTQLQPAALGLYLSTHLGASGLCLLRYWKRHSLPLLPHSLSLLSARCSFFSLHACNHPSTPHTLNPSIPIHSNADGSSNSSPLSAPLRKHQSQGKRRKKKIVPSSRPQI